MKNNKAVASNNANPSDLFIVKRAEWKSGRSGEQAADILQVPGHVVFYGFRRAIGFQNGELLKADILNGLHYRRKVDAALAQIVRIILQVDLANSIRAQPPD